MNHKWENDTCKNCGLNRERKTWKLLMAITGSTNHYRYGTGWWYYRVEGNGTFARPQCKQHTERSDI